VAPGRYLALARAGLMRKWLIVAFSLAWLGWELIAAFDHDPHTWPLTQVIVTYLPVWLYLPAALLLACWLPAHLWQNRKRRTPVRK
jgi:hypothetical protein